MDEVYVQDGIDEQAITIKDHLKSGIRISHEILDNAQDFSIVTYVRLNGFNSNNNLICAANSNYANGFIIGYNSKSDQYVDGWHVIINNTTYQITSDKTIDDREWHHVAFVRQQNKGKLYIDGKQTGDEVLISSQQLSVANNGLIIGQDQDCIGGCLQTNQNWNGDIDEMSFYNTAINDKQVFSLYNGVIAHYKFDDNLNDESGNNYHGEVLANTNYIEGGVNKQALSILDNPSNGVTLPYQVLDGVQDFTITSYIQLNGFNSNNNLLCAANSNYANGFIIGYNSKSDQYVDGWHVIINNETYQITSDKTIDDREWHHVAFVRQQNKVQLYIDGEQVGDDVFVSNSVLNVAPNGLIIGQDQDCVGGCFQSNQNWDGLVDDLCFFRKSLTSEEIKKMSNEVITSSIDVMENTQFVIYPNPATDFITINSSIVSTIQIMNSSGQFITSINVEDSKEVNLSGLNTGVYFILLYDQHGKKVGVQKLLVERN